MCLLEYYCRLIVSVHSESMLILVNFHRKPFDATSLPIFRHFRRDISSIQILVFPAGLPTISSIVRERISICPGRGTVRYVAG
jgi:hypothetical protein